MIVLDQDENNAGSFKAALWQAVQTVAPDEAIEAKDVEVRDGWLYSKDQSKPMQAMILCSSRTPQPERLLSLAARSTYPRLNPPRSGLVSKPEYQSLLVDLDIPTPLYHYNVRNTGRAVIKPAYGQAGTGVKMTDHVDTAYAQAFIANPFQVEAGWDIRIVMFMGEPIGAM